MHYEFSVMNKHNCNYYNFLHNYVISKQKQDR